MWIKQKMGSIITSISIGQPFIFSWDFTLQKYPAIIQGKQMQKIWGNYHTGQDMMAGHTSSYN